MGRIAKPRRVRHPITGQLVGATLVTDRDERERLLLADSNALDRAFRVLADYRRGLSVERLAALHKTTADDVRFQVDVALRARVTQRAPSPKPAASRRARTAFHERKTQ